jgi:tetratricopeptide (TPR) repeat protein
MNDKRVWRFQYRLPQVLPEEKQLLTVDQAEQELNRQLKEADKNPGPVLWELARLYNATHRQDQALHCLRRVLAGETEVEAKAHCVLALGQTMEQARDYPSAIRFYREAFAMEPANNDVWYFINNNLGYSYNQVEQPAEAETFCRAAIAINPGRHNAYKNLGIALQGLGKHREAAQCLVVATQKNANDPRATDHLRQLLEVKPELSGEFAGPLELCQRTIRYVADAGRRASQGIALRVLLGGNDSELNQTVVSALQKVIRRGSVEAVEAGDWEGIMEDARTGTSDLFVLAPEHIGVGETMARPLRLGSDMLKRIAACSPAPVVVLLAKDQLAEWRQAYSEVGADAVLGLPFHPNALAGTLKRCTQGHGCQAAFSYGTPTARRTTPRRYED